MKHILFSLSILLGLFACNIKQKPVTEAMEEKTISVNQLTEEEASSGWTLLFDGQSKVGWHIYNNQSDGAAWEVHDGTLHLNPRDIKVTPVPGAGDLTQAVGGGDLTTDEEFENFHLKLEWKVGEPSNSGVMINVNETPEHAYPWQTGPEVQIMHQRECTEEKNCVGDLYSLVAGPRDLEISDDWNTLEIISNQGNLEVKMNDRSLYTVTMWDDNWKAIIANTKFTAWPEFGTFTQGKIALQDHGHAVWYRNIKIRRL